MLGGREMTPVVATVSSVEDFKGLGCSRVCCV